MIRVFAESLTLFLIPSAIYFAFLYLTLKPGQPRSSVFARTPVLTLSVLGACLVTAVLTLFGNVGDGKPGQAYEPAIFKDGKVIPGHMK